MVMGMPTWRKTWKAPPLGTQRDSIPSCPALKAQPQLMCLLDPLRCILRAAASSMYAP